MTTTVAQLIERLEEIAEEHPDAEVLLATQPSWPLQFEISGVAVSDEFAEIPDDPCVAHDERGCAECIAEQFPTTVYIVEGGHPGGFDSRPYAPREAWEMASI